MEAVPLRSAQIQGQQKKKKKKKKNNREGGGVERGGGQELLYPMLHCQHQKDFCMKIGSDEGHFNVSSIVRGSHETTSVRSLSLPSPFCFTSTGARWLIRDGDGGKGTKE